MRRPSTQQLAEHWIGIVRAIAEQLAAHGHRGWIVGGAVRDLALGIAPLDVDMASAARPEEIEAWFGHTTAVGRAFGTVVVHLQGREVQLTTFRSEGGYSDARRPDRVSYGATVEEDAARRDFTCNALYLDPLDDTLLDPFGGAADLGRKLLRCVGEPASRFREDGLRLVRMARLAAALALEVDPATLEAARANAGALAGVSPERIQGELARIFEKPHAHRAVALLGETGVLARALPGQAELHPGGLDLARAQSLRIQALRALAEPMGLELGLSVLLDPSPLEPFADSGDFEAAERVLDLLKPSRATRRAVVELWRLEREIEALAELAIAARSARVRIARDPHGPQAMRLARAWHQARGSSEQPLDALESFARGLSADELRPEPLVLASDLARLALPPGPRWSALLEEAETLQLDQRLSSREAALAWLEERVRAAQDHDGGNTPRSANEIG